MAVMVSLFGIMINGSIIILITRSYASSMVSLTSYRSASGIHFKMIRSKVGASRASNRAPFAHRRRGFCARADPGVALHCIGIIRVVRRPRFLRLPVGKIFLTSFVFVPSSSGWTAG